MKSSSGTHLSRRGFLTALGLGAASTGCSRVFDFVKLKLKIKEKGEQPVVVIGAGLGGLTAGAYLARAGMPVTVVEQHLIPGGYATSFDRMGGKYTFEVSLHQSVRDSGSMEQILREIDVWDKVDSVEAPELCRVVAPDHDITLPQADLQGCVDVLAEQFPLEREGIQSFIERMAEISDHTKALPDVVGFWDRMTFPVRHKVLWEIRGKNLAHVLDQHINDPELKSLLAAMWGYYGLPPSKMSAFYYTIATHEYMKEGGHYYTPRSQALSNAIADTIETYGGKVLYGEEAEEILLDRGTVRGVRLKGGQELEASVVVSNASVPATMKKMLPAGEVPKKYLERIDGYKPSMSSFIVWLGLKQDVRDRVDGYEIFLQDTYDHEEMYRAGLNADAESAQLAVSLYDNLDPNYSQPGTNTMSIIFLSGYEPWRKFEADYEARRKDAYNAEKERLAKILVRRVEERLIPGLSEMIEVQVTSTPLTNVRYTHNPEGAIYGYAQSVDNAYMNRIGNRTPVDGLYLASAWGNPGGGYQGVINAGRGTAASVLEDL